MNAGELALAEAAFRHALELAPDLSEAQANLGLILDRRGMAEAAEACYRRSIELDPERPQTHLNLGALLASRKRFEEAEEGYRNAIMLNPGSPAAWSNLGVLYACSKREAEAEQCYRTALANDEAYANARFNLSYLLLRQARFEEGWHCLEARDWYAAFSAHLACPRWQGESLAGKSVLIGIEAGHGDMIQFCRYASILKARGAASLAIVCHPALKRLFASLAAVDRVISIAEELPRSGCDFWVPPLSIPYHCKTRLDSIPADIPYLHAEPQDLTKWAPLIPRDGLRVGLVWKGNPRFENDAERSLPSLEVLAPLWTVAGARFISLQKGAGEAEAAQPPAGLPLVNLGVQFEDFADAAAVISTLDLIISVDTAIAHLSGALGKPCWILLPAYKTDWRWLADRTDSPWYPATMRLFRQQTSGTWNEVVSKVVEALRERVASHAENCNGW